jgi:hypothetical protein
MKVFIETSGKLGDQIIRCEEYASHVIPNLLGTCKKDTIISEYVKTLKAFSEEIKNCSTKITMVEIF